MTKGTAELSLATIEAYLGQQVLPPVTQWSPTSSGSIDIQIRRDGSWWHEGVPIRREALVRLFASVLRREADGSHVLVTPATRLSITVEDVPFIAVAMSAFGEAESMTVSMVTNVGDVIVVDASHRLWVDYDDAQNPTPYVVVRDHLVARVSTSVYYQLAELAVERDAGIGVWSAGEFHLLWAPVPLAASKTC